MIKKTKKYERILIEFQKVKSCSYSIAATVTSIPEEFSVCYCYGSYLSTTGGIYGCVYWYVFAYVRRDVHSYAFAGIGYAIAVPVHSTLKNGFLCCNRYRVLVVVVYDLLQAGPCFSIFGGLLAYANEPLIYRSIRNIVQLSGFKKFPLCIPHTFSECVWTFLIPYLQAYPLPWYSRFTSQLRCKAAAVNNAPARPANRLMAFLRVMYALIPSPIFLC